MENTRYYAEYSENGTLLSFGIGYDGVEIDEEEYLALQARAELIQEKTEAYMRGEVGLSELEDSLREEVRVNVIEVYANALYMKTIAAEDVPAEIREAAQQRCSEIIASCGEYKSGDAEGDIAEALTIMG